MDLGAAWVDLLKTAPIPEVAVMFAMKIYLSKSLKRRPKSSQRKAVRCLETGLVYASSSDASDILSAEGKLIEPRNIISVCQGKQISAGGLKWEYVEIDPVHMFVMKSEFSG